LNGGNRSRLRNNSFLCSLISFPLYYNNKVRALFYPRMANENSCGRTAGFRAVDAISDEKIDPIPIPAPVRPIAASPAPMYFAAANIVNCFLIYTLCTAH
jgi:hypothetical protein